MFVTLHLWCHLALLLTFTKTECYVIGFKRHKTPEKTPLTWPPKSHQFNICVPNSEYCPQKTKKCFSSTMVEILFTMFSFGVAHPDFFPIAESFTKSKQTPIWQSEKRSTFWLENVFFKSNMDALTVLLGHWYIHMIGYLCRVYSFFLYQFWNPHFYVDDWKVIKTTSSNYAHLVRAFSYRAGE